MNWYDSQKYFVRGEFDEFSLKGKDIYRLIIYQLAKRPVEVNTDELMEILL